MRFRLPRASHLVALLALATAAAVVVAPGAVGARSTSDLVAVDAATDRKPLTVQSGVVNVVVTLAAPAVAVAAERQDLTSAQQRAYDDRLEAVQAGFSSRARAIVGGKELARVQTALNAVVLRVRLLEDRASSSASRASRASGRSTTTSST